MTSNDSPSTTPAERADELAEALRSQQGVGNVSASSDEDGAVVTCYAGVDHADEAETVARESGFEVGHRHRAEGEVYYLFGYAED